MTKCLGKPPIWGMVPEIQSGGKIFSSFWAIFCPFTSLTTRKIKILKKWKKLLERSSFYTCNKNHDLMMYASWDIERDRQNFLSFWASFCPFSPLTTQKIKILKKWKKRLVRYHHFTQVYQKSWSDAILFLRHGVWWMQLLFFILGYFQPFYPTTSPKNQNEKNTWSCHHFTHVYQKLWSDGVRFLRYQACH